MPWKGRRLRVGGNIFTDIGQMQLLPQRAKDAPGLQTNNAGGYTSRNIVMCKQVRTTSLRRKGVLNTYATPRSRKSAEVLTNVIGCVFQHRSHDQHDTHDMIHSKAAAVSLLIQTFTCQPRSWANLEGGEEERPS